MTRGPVTTLLHTAANSHWVDADALEAAVTDRLPDLDCGWRGLRRSRWS
jgi:hypothetical protein